MQFLSFFKPLSNVYYFLTLSKESFFNTSHSLFPHLSLPSCLCTGEEEIRNWAIRNAVVFPETIGGGCVWVWNFIHRLILFLTMGQLDTPSWFFPKFKKKKNHWQQCTIWLLMRTYESIHFSLQNSNILQPVFQNLQWEANSSI